MIPGNPNSWTYQEDRNLEVRNANDKMIG